MNCNINMVCPFCLSFLSNQGAKLACPECNNHFSIIDGIPSFAEISPLFEGRFIEHQKKSKYENNWFFPVLENIDIRRRRIFFLKKCLKLLNKESLLLDIGCGGGGWGLILNRYGIVIGMDVSMSSLRFARNIYKKVIHASVTQMPFPSDYFDAVVSEDVLGHIPLDEKERAYSEMFRVLKPDGVMVHAAIETDSKSFWFRFAKKYPDLFKTLHIDKHGHIGLELPSAIIERCQRIGFNVKKVDPIHAIILNPSLFSAWFDNEYRRKSRIISTVVSLSRAIEKSKRIMLLTNLVLGILEKMINPFIDVDQASGLLICCKK